MKLTVLVDNNSTPDSRLISEHGLFFIIEDGNVNLLFDCGSSDAFIKNAYNMQIDLTKITDIVLSHGHSDHIGGFPRLVTLYEQFNKSGIDFNPKKVMAHPGIFNANTNSFKILETRLSKDNIDDFFNLILTIEPKFITKKLIYLGEIPIRFGKKMRDYPLDETALAYKSQDGLIIFSGCSHSGIKNIIEHAKYITGEQRIASIIGGLYLFNSTEEEVNTVGKYLQEQKVKNIYPCHCTDDVAKAILSKYVKVEDITTGKEFNWN